MIICKDILRNEQAGLALMSNSNEDWIHLNVAKKILGQKLFWSQKIFA